MVRDLPLSGRRVVVAARYLSLLPPNLAEGRSNRPPLPGVVARATTSRIAFLASFPEELEQTRAVPAGEEQPRRPQQMSQEISAMLRPIAGEGDLSFETSAYRWGTRRGRAGVGQALVLSFGVSGSFGGRRCARSGGLHFFHRLINRERRGLLSWGEFFKRF